MTRARGQSSRTLLNSEYPHQVLVLSDSITGKTLDRVIAFHTQCGIPTKTRAARQDDQWYSLYCFADSQHAARFQAEFGGKIID
jgi:hypothetical protein